MVSRTLAGSVALKGDWDLGEDNWKDENDLNLLKLSVLTQGVAISLVSATPGGPAEGAIYLFSDTHPTQAGKVAVYDEGAWVYLTPATGWRLFDAASGFLREFNGTTWVEVTSGGGGSAGTTVQTEAGNYTVAPGDATHYIRLTSASAKTITVDLEATTALPANGEWNFRNVGAGDATITPAVGVTVNPPTGGTLVVPSGGTVTLKRAAADTFDLMGLVVPV